MIDVSPRALSIARLIDRLAPGSFTIEIVKPPSKTEHWIIAIKQSVVIVSKSLEQQSHPVEGRLAEKDKSGI